MQSRRLPVALKLYLLVALVGGMVVLSGAPLDPAEGAFPSATPCRAENMSQPTTCKEEDNVNIPIFDPAVKSFQITATHPTYQVNDYTCAADFSGCNAASAAGKPPDVCTQ